MKDYYISANPTGPTMAIDIDEGLCIGCNSCASICRIQTILPNPEKGKPPIVAYPDECWYCGCCVESCPVGALQMRLPINQRIMFKDKESGEIFRIGADDAPEKTFFKAPFGWLEHQELGKIMKALEKQEKPLAVVMSSETPFKIGKFFGEIEENDESVRLIRFLKKVGFNQVFIGDVNIEPKMDVVAVDLEKSEFENKLTVKGLSDLLHRLCVSNYTAVKIWRSLK